MEKAEKRCVSYINRGEMEHELGKNRETLENKRRKSCGPIYIKPFPAWRKYIMQSGIGEVVLRRETVAGKR